MALQRERELCLKINSRRTLNRKSQCFDIVIVYLFLNSNDQHKFKFISVHKCSLMFQQAADMSSIPYLLVNNVLISSPFPSPPVHLTWGMLSCAVFAHARRRWLFFFGRCTLGSQKIGFQDTEGVQPSSTPKVHSRHIACVAVSWHFSFILCYFKVNMGNSSALTAVRSAGISTAF